MASSHIKKIQNDIDEIEKDCDKFISFNKYYIIYLNFLPDDNCKNISLANIKKLGKIFLNNNLDHQPLLNYVFEDEIYLIFPPKDENSIRYLNGSYQKIISEYVSYFSNYLSCSKVECKIIEFTSQIQIISYFTLRIYLNTRRYIKTLLKDIDVFSETLLELTEELTNCGWVWDDIPNENKFGIFLKLKKQNEKVVISTLSETFDARNNQKYINYMFE